MCLITTLTVSYFKWNTSIKYTNDFNFLKHKAYGNVDLWYKFKMQKTFFL